MVGREDWRLYSAVLVFVAVTVVVTLGGRVVVAALAQMRKQALE
jgi:hypothetical protein